MPASVRADDRSRPNPVIQLPGRQLRLAEVRRLETALRRHRHGDLTLYAKVIDYGIAIHNPRFLHRERWRGRIGTAAGNIDGDAKNDS